MLKSPSAFDRLCLGAVTVAGLLSAAAFAQHQGGGQVIVMQDDDGQSPTVMQFNMPDFFELRQPDFMKRDLPTFVDKLVLSDEQAGVVDRLIAEYLDAFEKLKQEHLPKAEGPMHFGFGGGDGEGNEGGMFVLGCGDDDEGGLPDIGAMLEDNPDFWEFEGEMPQQIGVGVNVSVGGPDDEEDGGPPEAGVAISVKGPDGAEIPEEVRKKLEEQAGKIAEQIKKQLEEQMAKGDQDGEGAHMLPLTGATSIEDLQNQQKELAEQAEAFRSAKANLRQTFVTNAQTTLAEPQIERWPVLERTLRREKTLPKGRLSGERTDLVKVIKGLGLGETEHTAIATQVDGYELALDNALKQRNDNLPEAEAQLNKALRDGDTDKALSIIDRGTALRVAVRSVNEQYTDTIASQLPAERADAFRKAVLKSSYPNVYRTTFAQKNFAAVRKIEGLDSKTIATIDDLERAYTAELNDVNVQIRQTINKTQPLESRLPIEHTRALKEGQPPMEAMFGEEEGTPNPVKAAFERRRDLDDRYVKLVRELLTPEQADQLPKPSTLRPGQPIIIRRSATPAAPQPQ